MNPVSFLFCRKKLPRRRHVKQREPLGGSVTYKVYEKAPCIGLEPTGPLQAYIQHRTPVSINGNEYSHIWESPLPGEPLNPLHEAALHENAYGTQCDCATYSKGRRDLYLTQLSEDCSQPAECAHVPSGQVCQVAECFEGHRYFVLDRDASSAAACRDSNHSPDVVPPDGAC